MEKITQVNVSKIIRYGCSDDKATGWLDFPVEAENVLRLAFPVDFPPDIKLQLQILQGHISEERKKVGLPIIERSYVVGVERLEFGRDDLNQLAVIRACLQNGGSTETPLDKTQIAETIEFLKDTLRIFEQQTQSKH